MKHGIQVSSFKPLLKTPEQVRSAFSEMAALGCRYVQLQWIDQAVRVEQIAAALEENGLHSVAVQDFYQTVCDNLEYYVNLNAATGGTWLTVSRIPQRYKSRQGLDIFVKELRELDQMLRPLGQRINFHPVTADFTALPDFDTVGYLLDTMPELTLCLDLFHLNRNCGDMPGFIRRYAGRIPMVHFKDEDETGKLVPAGQGRVNYIGVVQACREAGVAYGFAEQETWEGDPYACLGQALAWLAGQ